MIQIDDHIFQNGLKAQSRKVATKSYLENVISKHYMNSWLVHNDL